MEIILNFVLNLVEFIVGAAGLIAWVTVLGLVFSHIAPEKLYKKKINRIDCIAMAGIGIFSSFLTLFFLFIAPKIGLARIDLTGLFGQFLGAGKEGVFFELLTKWGGRAFVITLGVIGSFAYGTLFFHKMKFSDKIKGLLFGFVVFLLGSFFVFPVLSGFNSIRHSQFSIPSFLGPLAGGFDPTMTFFAAMLIFGGLVAGIYHEWEEA